MKMLKLGGLTVMSDNSSLHFSWVDNPEQVGEMLFTFDGVQVFNLFRDYPNALTPEQKRLFDEANPFWVDFFKDRKYINNSDS